MQWLAQMKLTPQVILIYQQVLGHTLRLFVMMQAVMHYFIKMEHWLKLRLHQMLQLTERADAKMTIGNNFNSDNGFDGELAHVRVWNVENCCANCTLITVL